jgi:hypothetical protein
MPVNSLSWQRMLKRVLARHKVGTINMSHILGQTYQERDSSKIYVPPDNSGTQWSPETSQKAM